MRQIIAVGQRFHNLELKERAPGSKSGKAQWSCLCSCGTEIIVTASNLRTGHTKSCGCLRKGVNATHGHTSENKVSPEYRAWRSMIQRCTNPSQDSFYLYGGKIPPVTICERWKVFENFLSDVGNKPEPKDTFSLDRFPNKDGNYEPGNVRWATGKQQANNRRNRKIGFSRGGISTEQIVNLHIKDGKSITETAAIVGMTMQGVLHRLKAVGIKIRYARDKRKP